MKSIRSWGSTVYFKSGHWWNDNADAKVNTERWWWALCWAYIMMYHWGEDEREWNAIEYWIEHEYEGEREDVKQKLEEDFQLWVKHRMPGMHFHPIEMLMWHFKNSYPSEADNPEFFDLNDSEVFERVVSDYGFYILCDIWHHQFGMIGIRSLSWLYGVVELAYLKALGQNICTLGLEFATNAAFAFEDCEIYPRRAFGRWMHYEIERGDTVWLWRDGIPVEAGTIERWNPTLQDPEFGQLVINERCSKGIGYDAIDVMMNYHRGYMSNYVSPGDVWIWNGVRWARPSKILGKELFNHERQGRLGAAGGEG